MKREVKKFGLSHLHRCWTELAIFKVHGNLDDMDSLLEVYKQELLNAKAKAGKPEEMALADHEAMRQFLIR